MSSTAKRERFKRCHELLGLTYAAAAELLCLSGKGRIYEILSGRKVPSERLVRLYEFEAGLRLPSTHRPPGATHTGASSNT
jgi:hypothetical protein